MEKRTETTETKACAVCCAIVKHTRNASGDLVPSAAHRASLHHMRAVSNLAHAARMMASKGSAAP